MTKHVTITTQEQAEQLLYTITQQGKNLYYIDGYDIMDNDISNKVTESDVFYYYDNNNDVITVKCDNQDIINYLLQYSFEQ